MTLSKGKRQVIGYVSLFILILVFIFFYLQISSHYPFNPFFPPSGKTTYLMELTYPPISNGKIQELLLDASFSIVSDKPLAEGVNITIPNPVVKLYGGSFNNRNIIKNIRIISIAFQNAQPMGGSVAIIIPLENISQTQHVYYNLPPGASFQVNEETLKFPEFPREQVCELNLSNGYLKGIRQNQPFNFSVSGDYSPSLIIEFYNESPESYTYDEIKLHVPSKSELQSQELDQINGFIAAVLLIFSFIEALRLIQEWIRDAP